MSKSPGVSYAVSIADPDNPTHVLKPTAGGAMPLSGSLTLDPTNLNLEATQLLVKAAILLQNTRIAAGYETVAAAQTAQVLGGAGAAGDYLARLIITPALAAAGVVTLLDGATSIPIYAGGAVTALPNLEPVTVEIGAVCTTAWKITTGASVSVVAVGNFT